MRIVLFAHNLKVGGGLIVGGNLISTMLEAAPMHDYLVVIPSQVGYPDYAKQDNVQVLECPRLPLWRRIFWEHSTLRKAIIQFSPDWIWALGNLPIPKPHCRQSLLIHRPYLVYDIGDGVSAYSMKQRIYYKILSRVLRNNLRYVDRVYCQSDVMCRRFCKVYSFPESQMGLCRTPISSDFLQKRDYKEPEVFNRYSSFFKLFYPTHCFTHKNIQSIVEMYRQYPEDLAQTVCFLTFDKNMNPLAKEICERIRQFGLEDRILTIGSIPHSQLYHYYRSADALLFPSRLETLGLPQWEAMASGLPVIVSDCDYAHEACGDAAIFVDPYSISSMKDGVLQLMGEEALRNSLIKRGHDQVHRMVRMWPDVVRQVLDIEKIQHS